MSYKPKNRKFEQRERTRFSAMASANSKRSVRREAQALVSPGARRFLLMALPLAIIALALAWFFGDAFRINKIEVIGNDNVPTDTIRGVSGLMGQHPLSINAGAAAKTVSDLPGVGGAQVQCGWGKACAITILPAEPMAVWRASGGQGDVWTDTEGKVQRVTGQISAPLVVKVEEGAPPTLGTLMDAGLARALKELQAAQPGITTYLYTAQYGVMFTDERGTRIRVGTSEREGAVKDKLALAAQLRGQLAAQKVTPKVIDVRFANAPFYTK